MKLESVADVKAAIDEITNGDHPNTMKPAEVKLRASRLADLYEVRASMWKVLGPIADLSDVIPDAYRAACVVAEKHDRDQVRYWRTQAGAR